jgi:hypothetical protein
VDCVRCIGRKDKRRLGHSIAIGVTQEAAASSVEAPQIYGAAISYLAANDTFTYCRQTVLVNTRGQTVGYKYPRVVVASTSKNIRLTRVQNFADRPRHT